MIKISVIAQLTPASLPFLPFHSNWLKQQTYRIFHGGSSKLLQTELIAQSHEKRAKLKVPVRQIAVLRVIPSEHKWGSQSSSIELCNKLSEGIFQTFFLFLFLFFNGACKHNVSNGCPGSVRTWTWHLWLSPCPLQTGTSAAGVSARPSVSAHFSEASDGRSRCNFLQHEVQSKREKRVSLHIDNTRETITPLSWDLATRCATASFLCWKSCSLMTSSDRRCLLAAKRGNC